MSGLENALLDHILTEAECNAIQAPPYTKLEELDEYARRGDQILSVPLESMPVNLLAPLGTFLAKLESAKDITLVRAYGTITAHLPVTPDQLRDRLEQANERLKTDRERYLTALQFGGPGPSDYGVKESIRRFGTRAGLPTTIDSHQGNI